MASPTLYVRPKPDLILKCPLQDYPKKTDDPDWTKEKFLAAGFPANPLPPPGQVASTINKDGLRRALDSRRQVKPLSRWEEDHISEIADWFTNGAPDNHRPVQPNTGRHHLAREEIPHAVDTLARFAKKGFVAGPLNYDDLGAKPEDLHSIGVFLKPRAHDQTMRVICDLSSPAGRSVNDSNNPDPTIRLPFHMASSQDVIEIIIFYGRDALFLKLDIESAYKLIPVRQSVYFRQAIILGKAVFIDLAMMFGSSVAPHLFTFAHSTLQEVLVLARLQSPKFCLQLAVDDSTFIGPAGSDWCQKYDDLYREVMAALNFTVKEPDPKRSKAFDAGHTGSVLGLELDSNAMTFHLSDNKITDICLAIDDIVDVTDIKKVKLVPLKTIQTCYGKIGNVAKSSFLLRTLLMVFATEKARCEKRLSAENALHISKQSNLCLVSLHVRERLALIRAIIACCSQHRFPMQIFTPRAVSDQIIFTDASGAEGDKTDQNYRPTCFGFYRPATVQRPSGLCISYIVPDSFLNAMDLKDRQRTNTCLLELCAAATHVWDDPREYAGKTTTIVTDNLGLSYFWAKSNPRNYITSIILESFQLLLRSIDAEVNIVHRPRCSDAPTRISDAATHADFRECSANTCCSIRQLPPPLHSALTSLTSYHAHRLDLLWPDTKLFLSNIGIKPFM